MSRTSSSITIRRPIEDVFAVLTNVENTGTWFPGNVEEHWTSPPPHGAGSTRHAVVTVLGRRTENDAVVTAYEPPYRAVTEGTSPNAPFVATLTFASDGDSTRVDATTELVFHGATRIIGPLAAAMYGRAWGHGLVKLKRMMETAELEG